LKIIFFAFIYLTVNSSFSIACPEALRTNLEKYGKVRFCRLENFMVSKNCFEKGASCELLTELKEFDLRIKKIKETRVTEKQNPGAYVCNELGWDIIMGKMSDGSELCVCKHTKKSFIICTSLI